MKATSTRFHRMLLLGCGFFYFAWWFAVDLLLPGSFNPFGSRMAVVLGCFGVWAASYRFPRVERNLPRYFAGCLWVATFHYFYLFYFNHDAVNWIIGSYITIVVCVASLQETRALFAYSLWTASLVVGLSVLNHELLRTIFLPGIFTILFFANLGLRARVRLTERVREGSRKFQNLFDGTFEGIAVMDAGVVIEANEALARMLGYRVTEVIGRYVGDFVASESRDIVLGHIERESESRYEAFLLHKNGSRLEVEIAAKRHEIEGRRLRLTAVRDLTERKRAERNYILYESAREALRARDEFISTVSHELKTPLTIIKLQSQLAQRTLARETDPRLREAAMPFEETDRQVNRLVQLVEDMLDLSRISSTGLKLDRAPVDLSEVARLAVESLHPPGGENSVRIDFRAEKGLVVQGDKRRLEQLVLNLLTNAQKYGEGKAIEVTCFAEGDRACLAVKDSGIGIRPEDRARIFQRFERTAEARGLSGLGLGLYISKQIVDAHQGTIRVESELGQGSRFVIELPRST